MHPLIVILAVVVVLVLLILYVFPLLPRPLNVIFTVVAVLVACWVILATVGLVPPVR